MIVRIQHQPTMKLDEDLVIRKTPIKYDGSHGEKESVI